MQHKYLHHIYLLLILAFGFKTSHAAIAVDSVHVTISTCPNNGTAKVYARSTNSNAVFLFNVVAGPVTYTQQNDSTFYSLYPGSYTGWVHDINSFDSTQFTFSITGNYVEPVITASGNTPLCANGNNGQVVGHLTAGTGVPPYRWQIISPDSTTLQVSNIFNGLDSGIYLLRIIDGCGTGRVAYDTIAKGGSDLQILGYPQITFVSCDSVTLTVSVKRAINWVAAPITCTITTPGAVKIFSVVPAPGGSFPQPGSGVFTIGIGGVNYGDSLRLCLTDTCGFSICEAETTIPPFVFDIFFSTHTAGCQTGEQGSIALDFRPEYYDRFSAVSPFTVFFTDTATGVVRDSITFYSSQNGNDMFCSYCFTLPPLPAGNYLFTVKDSCGHLYQNMVYWLPVPGVTSQVNFTDPSCLDSTVACFIDYAGLDSPAVLTILSGPAVSQSSTPGFAYHHQLTYPMVYWNDLGGAFAVGNMPNGNYTYSITDRCGNVVYGAINISNAPSLKPKYEITHQCGRTNTISVTVFPYTGCGLYNPALHQWIQGSGGPVYTFSQLPDGVYYVNLYYGTFTNYYLTGNNACWSVIDTLYIHSYGDSLLKATDVATCNGIVALHINVYSANGKPPYKYEILSGPQTFLPQDSATFISYGYGTYLMGVIDSCGDVDTRYITIDTGRFDPVIKTGGWCVGSKAELFDISSPYLTYVWHKPDGSTYTGDTLKIDPFMPADTGQYNIEKIVHINSCRDTVYGTYHLMFKDTFQQSIALCQGDTLQVGDIKHGVAGLYLDTLAGQYGCDSILYISLTFYPRPQVGLTMSDSSLCRSSNVILSASGGTAFLWQPGNYNTDTITVNPSITTLYIVTVSDTGICSGTDSVLVYPVVNGLLLSIYNEIMCPGTVGNICIVNTDSFSSYYWSDGETALCLNSDLPGNYTVMATTSWGCIEYSDTVHVMQYNAITPVIVLNGGVLGTTGTYVTYQWYFNGNALVGGTAPTFGSLYSGSFTLQVTDTNGCTLTSAPYIISGISNITAPSISVSPNPNNTNQWQVTVSAELANAQCQIFDVDGKAVYTTHLTGANNAITTNLGAGTYIMRISTGQSIYNIKLVQF